MMRSLFSGVAGLKTHQTRMDVIGNNIANVNTTAYKSQSMVFSDLLYQTTQAASGANADTGRGGINPRQIGLGSKTGAISTAITTQGSAQSTNNPFDIMITGDSFFVVNNGSQNFFTRDGSFTIDGAGNLVMSTTGYKVMGWQVDPETGDIRADMVSALQIMNEENLVADPEATTRGYVAGILDKNDSDVHSTAGKVITLTFFDNLGYQYTAKFSVHSKDTEGRYRVQLDDIIDADSVSLVKKYNLTNIEQIASFGAGSDSKTTTTSLFRFDEEKIDYDNASSTYSLTTPFSDILDGYSDNALLLASKNVKVTGIDDGKTVAKGTEVSVTGSVTLTKADLESEPYNLIYSETDKKYYTKQVAADGKVTSVAVGTGTGEVPWTTALANMKGLGNVTNVTVTPGENGTDQTIAFTVEKLKTNRESVYNANSFGIQLTYPADSKEILKQVFQLEDSGDKSYSIDYISPDGYAQIITSESNAGFELVYDVDNGHFSYIGGQGQDSVTLAFNASASSLSGDNVSLTHFENIDIDFSKSNMFNNGKTSTISGTSGAGDENNTGSGRKRGEMIGVEVGQDGKITASYDNGMTKLLGQIAVANFANASGLAKAGDNLYSATMNSGEFDGVGEDITASGGTMTSGVLEMSNVDLSSEFTEMITTQRGFQANSRIITVSDTLLEELVNLKR